MNTKEKNKIDIKKKVRIALVGFTAREIKNSLKVSYPTAMKVKTGDISIKQLLELYKLGMVTFEFNIEGIYD